MNWGSLLKTLRGTSSEVVRFTWVPTSWLAAHTITGKLSNLLFWTSGITTDGASLVSNEKALAKGLVLRSVATSATDTLAWYKKQPAEVQPSLLLGQAGPSISLADSMDRERDLLAAWHADAGDT
jgi:hypothetical protein